MFQLLRQNKELIGLLNKLVTENPSKSDPFTELAMESLIKYKKESIECNTGASMLFNETPIHMNSTVVKGGAKIDSITATPIHDKSGSSTEKLDCNHNFTFYVNYWHYYFSSGFTVVSTVFQKMTNKVENSQEQLFKSLI